MTSSASRESCDAIGKLLAHITRRWTLHVLWILISNGPTRFGALRRKVPGISARVLTLRLRELESVGLVHREFRASAPPEATYSLTAMAVEIGTILEELHHAANRWAVKLPNTTRPTKPLLRPVHCERPDADRKR